VTLFIGFWEMSLLSESGNYESGRIVRSKTN